MGDIVAMAVYVFFLWLGSIAYVKTNSFTPVIPVICFEYGYVMRLFAIQRMPELAVLLGRFIFIGPILQGQCLLVDIMVDLVKP